MKLGAKLPDIISYDKEESDQDLGRLMMNVH